MMIWRLREERKRRGVGGAIWDLAAAAAASGVRNSEARRREKRSGNWLFWMAVLGLGYRDGSTFECAAGPGRQDDRAKGC